MAYNNRSDLGNGSRTTVLATRGPATQMTGRYNYQNFCDWIKDPRVMEGVDYVADTYPFTAAAWWWMDNRMNDFCAAKAPTISR